MVALAVLHLQIWVTVLTAWAIVLVLLLKVVIDTIADRALIVQALVAFLPIRLLGIWWHEVPVLTGLIGNERRLLTSEDMLLGILALKLHEPFSSHAVRQHERIGSIGHTIGHLLWRTTGRLRADFWRGRNLA